MRESRFHVNPRTRLYGEGVVAQGQFDFALQKMEDRGFRRGVFRHLVTLPKPKEDRLDAVVLENGVTQDALLRGRCFFGKVDNMCVLIAHSSAPLDFVANQHDRREVTAIVAEDAAHSENVLARHCQVEVDCPKLMPNMPGRT
jgi:hypothetical protein